MRYFLRSFIILIILILIWQILVTIFQLPSYILPSPSAVFMILLTQYPLIASHALTTLIETLLGFLLGILCGSLAGIVIAFFPRIALWLLPLIIISQAVPTFAVAPLLVIWFGYGLTSKIITAVIMIFFPITSALYDGLQHTRSGWLDLAKTMQAKRYRVFLYIRLPAALPALASGIRIAAVAAPIGAVVGEWVGSSRGLGYLMLNANARLQIDVMFAALLVIIMLSLFLYFIVDKLLRRFIWWQGDQ